MKREAYIFGSPYVNGQQPLAGAVVDMRNWVKYLKSLIGGAWKDDEIKPYLTTPDGAVLLTIQQLDNILSQITSFGATNLESIISSATLTGAACLEAIECAIQMEDETYRFVTFSGHGCEDTKGQLLLCFNDNNTHLKADRLIPKRFGTVIFDCCRTVTSVPPALITESADIIPSVSLDDPQKYHDAFASALNEHQYDDTVVIQSCDQNESAVDYGVGFGGGYTYGLIQAARKWANSKGLDSEKEYSMLQAHKGACKSLERHVCRQSPQYSPIETSYPFAIRLGGAN